MRKIYSGNAVPRTVEIQAEVASGNSKDTLSVKVKSSFEKKKSPQVITPASVYIVSYYST